ncbi:hypothetical protein KEM56_007304, partial [Ascosphaera pollenicola]
EWNQALANVYRVLKPGGIVLFRDYGRGDLAQVRFKKGRYLDDNFYIRGDGTRVYFFEKEQLEHSWGKFSLESGIPPYDTQKHIAEASEEGENGEEAQNKEEENAVEDTKQSKPGFEVLDLGVDRRLLVNRQKQLKMYRCWIQGRFKKRAD